MSDSMNHVRGGLGSVRPYLYGYLDLPEFVQKAFDGSELHRTDRGDNSYHIEMQVGDSVLVIEAGELPVHAEPTIASVYVYVPDADAAYATALELGATSVMEPGDMPYAERSAGVKDTFGNTWWISTFVEA